MNSVFLLSAIIFGYSVVLVRAIGPLGAFGVGVGSSKCDPSITTASGTYAMHKGNLNAIFEERKNKYFSQIQLNNARSTLQLVVSIVRVI